MSRSWNGESLVDELSALLGDTSTTFKTRVLGWANDVIFDIATRHDWGYHLVKGKKIIALGEETHNLEINPPAAPTASLVSGGTLTRGSSYSVLLTFVQSSGVESVSGEKSAVLTTTVDSQGIYLEDLPTSPESMVTSRNVYLKKDDGKFYFHSRIDDNFSTTLTIFSEADSPIQPPDYESIRRIKGAPFFESSPSVYLKYKDEDQLRALVRGQWKKGVPEYFSPVDGNTLVTYPAPSYDMEISLNYYRYPKKLYYTADSQPDLPINLKPVLKAGIVALGYEYRDRAGQEMKRANYENSLVDSINRGARVANVEYVVKDVYGNFNGFEVN